MKRCPAIGSRGPLRSRLDLAGRFVRALDLPQADALAAVEVRQ
jgi:hypothetical protein